MSDKTVIKVKHLCKHFEVGVKEPGLRGSIKSIYKRNHKIVPAVDDVSFNINKGELIGFIGPNGAGKTTTLKTLSGLLFPTSGSVEVLGYNPYERDKEFLKQLSLIMGQKNQLIWDLPAIESFNLNKEIYEVSDKDYNEILDELVEMLEIGGVINQQVRKLSLGQRMKCEIVAALIHTPKVLFLDEPTIGLDIVVQKKLRQFIRGFNQKYNSTIILTSHYMGDVQELCERVIIIDGGKLGYDGKLDDLVKKYAKYKYITLVFLRPIDKDRASKYGKVVEFEPLKVVYEIPRDQVRETASNMLKDLPVDDLDIAEIPIEEIIGEVFEHGT